MQKRSLASRSLTVTALLLTPACLENEEEIEIRPDGSVRITVGASGDFMDFTDGFPVPLDVAWEPQTLDTRRWLALVGNDTGSAAVQERAPQVKWPRTPDDDPIELRVSRTFEDVEAWTEWFGPEEEPYRSAYMRRSASLKIHEGGDRRVFEFERTYRGTDYGRFDFPTLVLERLPDLVSRFEEPDPYTPEEWQRLRDGIAEIHAEVAEHFVRDALLQAYQHGNASLSPRSIPRVLDAVLWAVDQFTTVEGLVQLHAATLGSDPEEEQALADYDRAYREAVRRSFEEVLTAERVDAPSRNAILFALEWGFTSFDQYTDLADEDFTIALQMPGVLVGGNFDEETGNVATWTFDGAELHEGDVVIRAISVLE